MPETAILDHTMQLDKIHAGRDGDVKRHKPSRDHIQRLSRGLDPDQQAEVLYVHYTARNAQVAASLLSASRYQNAFGSFAPA